MHATAIALWQAGGWRGVLLTGPSGAGKSDLALRAMARGGRLVADDRVVLWRSGGRLFGRPPPRLAGLVEARGLGVTPARALSMVEIFLAVALVDAPEMLERTPEPERVEIDGVRIVRIGLFARADSALAKLEFALQAATLGAEREPAYLAGRGDEAEAPGARRGPLKRIR